MSKDTLITVEERPSQLTAALSRAPWWMTLIVYFGLPSSMGFIAFLVFLGIVPSPYMLGKFTALETMLQSQNVVIAELQGTTHDIVEQLRKLRTCLKHPEWKSCDD